MPTSTSHRLITWDGIVPRLDDLIGRRTIISWGNRGEKRWATCDRIRYNEAGQLMIDIKGVTEVYRGEHLSDGDFGKTQHMTIDNSLKVWVSDRDTITFSQLGTDISFIAPVKAESTTIQPGNPG